MDQGVVPLYGTDGEVLAQGLDDLGGRCARYYAQGARFAKWRAVYHIKESSGAPSGLSIQMNAETLARYAAICQANGLVPIVEPEILMDGTHDIEVSAAVTEKVLAAVFKSLSDHHVLLEGILLKPNMARSGEAAATQASALAVGELTVRVMQRCVPCAVPGLVFLSGGMSEEESSLALQAMNVCPGRKPWALSFSFGRALQQSCLKAWQGEDANILKAQGELLLRAKANSEATRGVYKGDAGSCLSKPALQAGSCYSNYEY